jgi:hypothetical protein
LTIVSEHRLALGRTAAAGQRLGEQEFEILCEDPPADAGNPILRQDR